jgi:hypothetical protein
MLPLPIETIPFVWELKLPIETRVMPVSVIVTAPLPGMNGGDAGSKVRMIPFGIREAIIAAPPTSTGLTLPLKGILFENLISRGDPEGYSGPALDRNEITALEHGVCASSMQD